ncbi:aldo/keto reductase [uncultured Megasphaera sp.]|uniref:aldo/keto reductase n=1 Tax=uncultured Megasphaera sp. TaxID=165188 RepID=UPI00261A047A|nr:aldo/keto reductase [uncultured Megasphaera sp.]
MEYTTLSNDVQVPLLGLGTFMISPEDTEKSVYAALKMGYRLIDTANAYVNEEAVGKGLRRALEEGLVQREDVFISTKLWPTLYEKAQAVDKTLERLGVDYVDLLFIHQPTGNYLAGYTAIEQAYHDGKARSLGISNFHGDKLEKLLAHADVKPHVIQLETHPYHVYDDIMARLAEYGTKLMGWYPLGHGDPELFRDPVFMALADKYHKSTVQIILRWAVQRQFITIPGTKNPEHLRSNFDIFDFALTDEEMAAVNGLNGTRQYYTATPDLEARYANMHLPFEDK